MPDGKMLTIKPIVDINYNDVIYRAGSEPFDVPVGIAKRLIESGSAKEVKKK